MGEFYSYTKEYWDAADKNEQAKIRKDYWHRARAGKEEWNKWATSFAETIKNKQADGKPVIYFGLDPLPPADKSKNDEQQKQQTVEADYHDFAGFIFPATVTFAGVVFTKQANFSDTKFKQSAKFERAKFKQEANFDSAEFEKVAKFRDAKFKGVAVFESTQFKQVDFSATRFKQGADFSDARFGQADFDGAKFYKQVPDFSYVTWQQPPRLSQMYIPDQGNKPKYNVFRYRKLKEMAKQAHDHEQELRFFAYELKAKRGIEQTGKWDLAANHLYEIFSGFGRSALMPLFWLGFSVLISLINIHAIPPNPTNIATSNCTFAALSKQSTTLSPYSPHSEVISAQRAVADNCPRQLQSNKQEVAQQTACLPPIYGRGYAQLFYVINNSMPLNLLSQNKREVLNKCLFGKDNFPPIFLQSVLAIQHWFAVVMWFLFLLAWRNRFRIK